VCSLAATCSTEDQSVNFFFGVIKCVPATYETSVSDASGPAQQLHDAPRNRDGSSSIITWAPGSPAYSRMRPTKASEQAGGWWAGGGAGARFPRWGPVFPRPTRGAEQSLSLVPPRLSKDGNTSL